MNHVHPTTAAGRSYPAARWEFDSDEFPIAILLDQVSDDRCGVCNARLDGGADAPVFTAEDARRYLDAAMGWRSTYRVIELAESEGFQVSAAVAEGVQRYRDSGGARDAEAVFELAYQATDYLQSITEDGLAWTWAGAELDLVVEGGHNG